MEKKNNKKIKKFKFIIPALGDIFRKNSEKKHLKKFKEIYTNSRASVVRLTMRNHIFYIHDGQAYQSLRIKEDFIGHKLGEFVLTRKFHINSKKSKHLAKKKKIKKK